MYKMNIKTVELSKKVQVLRKLLAENKIISRYRSVFRGKGLEFEGYRIYTENDDAKSIDWKASIKSDKLIIKEFKEERSMDVYFLYDVSSSMLFGSTDRLKSEYAAEMVSALTDLIISVGDRVGMFMFNQGIVKKIPPEATVNHYYFILRELVDTNNYGGSCNLASALDHVIRVVRRNSLLFIVSDFIGLGEGWEHLLRLSKKRFDLIGLSVIDPRDVSLPRDVGNVMISNPFTNDTMLINPKEIGDEYEAKAKERLEHIEKEFIRGGGEFLRINTDKSFVRPLVNFLKRREILLSK